MKRTALKPDPEKVREWLRRSQQRAREAQHASQNKVREDVTSAPSKAKSKPKKKAPVTFKPQVSAREFKCERCRRFKGAHWHHWLPQESIKVYVRGLRLPEDAERARLRVLLHDRRNVSALCVTCHGNTGTLGHRMTRKDVKPSAFEFARELGPEWLARLERSYPEAT
jgi:hypothetical protein